MPNRSEEHRRLTMLQSLGLTGAAPDQSLQALAALAADIAGASSGLVCLIESDRILVAGAVGFDEPLIDRWDSFCSHALLNPNEVLWVSDAREEPRFQNLRYVVGEPRARIYAGVRQQGFDLRPVTPLMSALRQGGNSRCWRVSRLSCPAYDDGIVLSIIHSGAPSPQFAKVRKPTRWDERV